MDHDLGLNLKMLAGGLVLLVLCGFVPRTRRFFRFLLWSWWVPSGLYWLAYLFLGWGMATVVIGMVVAGLGLLIGARQIPGYPWPRGRDNPGIGWLFFDLTFWLGLGMVSVFTVVARLPEPPPLPPDQPLLGSQPLSCDGVTLGEATRDVQARLGKGGPAATRPILKIWYGARTVYYGSTEVIYDRNEHVIAVAGSQLEQAGHLLAAAGHVQARVKRVLGPNPPVQIAYAGGAVRECYLGHPLELPSQLLTLNGLQLEMSQTQVEEVKLAGSPLPSPGGDLRLLRYPDCRVVYQEGIVVAIVGSKLNPAGVNPAVGGFWLTPVSYAYDLSHARDPVTGCLLMLPAPTNQWEPFSRDLEKTLENQLRKPG